MIQEKYKFASPAQMVDADENFLFLIIVKIIKDKLKLEILAAMLNFCL